MSEKLKEAFIKIKDEFNEHLESINQNTNEIQANYEFLCELDEKIDKLAERLEKISMLLEQKTEEKTFKIDMLTRKEQEVFMALYILEDEKGAVSYIDLARRLGITIASAQNYILNLIEKGVPITKKYINQNPFLTLEPEFKQQQTKNNILQIEPAILTRQNF